MTVSADIHIQLDVHSPKKDAAVADGVPTVGATEIAIWANDIPNQCYTTQVIATLWTIFNAMESRVKAGSGSAIIASGIIDCSESEVSAIAPIAGEIGIYVGTTVSAKAQTHFFERTLKRITERYLEEAKDGCEVVA